MVMYDNAYMTEIWLRVFEGVGEHGSFLLSFADTWLRADRENQCVLNQVSNDLIEKYSLKEVLRARQS